jgi:hypothetical protein
MSDGDESQLQERVAAWLEYLAVDEAIVHRRMNLIPRADAEWEVVRRMQSSRKPA